jgi:hypothetical protein
MTIEALVRNCQINLRGWITPHTRTMSCCEEETLPSYAEFPIDLPGSCTTFEFHPSSKNKGVFYSNFQPRLANAQPSVRVSTKYFPVSPGAHGGLTVCNFEQTGA